MNHSTQEWPVSIERDTTGHLRVLMSDGASVELEAFKDDCRRCAAELRQQAIADFYAAVFSAVRGFGRHGARFIASRFTHRAGAPV